MEIVRQGILVVLRAGFLPGVLGVAPVDIPWRTLVFKFCEEAYDDEEDREILGVLCSVSILIN